MPLAVTIVILHAVGFQRVARHSAYTGWQNNYKTMQFIVFSYYASINMWVRDYMASLIPFVLLFFYFADQNIC